MNFASKKLNKFHTGSGSLTAREKYLIAENGKLKKRNKRLSSAMLFLVGAVEKRLPFFNSKLRANDASNMPPKSTLPKNKADDEARPLTPRKELTKRTLPVRAQPKKRKIVGEAWQPENLNIPEPLKPKQPRRKDPLSMQQIFAAKKLNQNNRETPVPESVKRPTLPESPPAGDAEPMEVPSLDLKPDEIFTAEEVIAITPDLAPHEVSILAAPTKDQEKEKRLDVFHPQPSEIMTDREDKKTTARDASLAYLAVSVAAKPVPKTEVLTDLDDSDIIDNESLEKQVAQQNEMMRAAMLRRVNRLRW